LYIDTALSFGTRLAPKIFTAIVDAVEWIIRQERVKYVIHYLDNFLVIGGPASPKCAVALGTLSGAFARLGLPVANEKLEGHWYCLNILGFELAMVTCLPQVKLTEQHTTTGASLKITKQSCTN